MMGKNLERMLTKAYWYDVWIRNSEISVIFYRARLWYFRNFVGFDTNYTYPATQGETLEVYDGFCDPLLGSRGETLHDHQGNILCASGNGELDMDLWKNGQLWGNIHPDYPHQYAHKSAIEISNGTMKMITKYRPEVIEINVGKPNYQKLNSTYAHGEITLRKKHGYGVFEIRCKAPRNHGGWAAFWMYMRDRREIDIFEFFPKNVLRRSVRQTITVHWLKALGKTVGSMSPKRYKLPLDTVDHFHTYTCIRTADQLVFMFNGLVIRKVTNKSIMKRYEGELAAIIVGTGIHHDFLPSIPENVDPDPYEVDHVKIWKF